jgi:hypothetical protein
LLTSFVRVTLVCDQASKALAKANDKTRSMRMKILEQAVKAQAMLVTKLRLAPPRGSMLPPLDASTASTGPVPMTPCAASRRSFLKMTGDVDRKALQRAMAIVMQRDRVSAEHLKSKLEDEPWDEVAEFAAMSCQYHALALKPWQEPPCHADEDDRHPRDPMAQRLLRKMLAAGVSRYDPDPLTALAGAKRR